MQVQMTAQKIDLSLLLTSFIQSSVVLPAAFKDSTAEQSESAINFALALINDDDDGSLGDGEDGMVASQSKASRGAISVRDALRGSNKDHHSSHIRPLIIIQHLKSPSASASATVICMRSPSPSLMSFTSSNPPVMMMNHRQLPL